MIGIACVMLVCVEVPPLWCDFFIHSEQPLYLCAQSRSIIFGVTVSPNVFKQSWLGWLFVRARRNFKTQSQHILQSLIAHVGLSRMDCQKISQFTFHRSLFEHVVVW